MKKPGIENLMAQYRVTLGRPVKTKGMDTTGLLEWYVTRRVDTVCTIFTLITNSIKFLKQLRHGS
jgi:hypothetical protein